MRHEVADDGLAIFDLRFNAGFRKRLAGYDRREVELYIRQQQAVMTKIRLEKEQLERQVIRLRQQLMEAREQLVETKDGVASASPGEERVGVNVSPSEGIGQTEDVDTAATSEDAVDGAATRDAESTNAAPAMPDAESRESDEADSADAELSETDEAASATTETNPKEASPDHAATDEDGAATETGGADGNLTPDEDGAATETGGTDSDLTPDEAVADADTSEVASSAR